MTYKTRGLFFEQLTAMSPLNTNNIPTTQSLPFNHQHLNLPPNLSMEIGCWTILNPKKCREFAISRHCFHLLATLATGETAWKLGGFPCFYPYGFLEKSQIAGESKILVQFNTGEISKLSDSQSPAFLVSKVYGLHTHLVCKQVNYVVSGEQFLDGRCFKPIYVFL